MFITNKAQYLSQDFDMAKAEFDILYLCSGGGGLWYFPLINQHLLRGGGGQMRRGFKKKKRKNKEIIIAHPLDKLWMLPNVVISVL